MDTKSQDLEHSPASLRALRGFTKDRLCKEAGVSFEHLTMAEAGGNAVRMETVAALATALDVPLTTYVAAMEREAARRAASGSAA